MIQPMEQILNNPNAKTFQVQNNLPEQEPVDDSRWQFGYSWIPLSQLALKNVYLKSYIVSWTNTLVTGTFNCNLTTINQFKDSDLVLTNNSIYIPTSWVYLIMANIVYGTWTTWIRSVELWQNATWVLQNTITPNQSSSSKVDVYWILQFNKWDLIKMTGNNWWASMNTTNTISLIKLQ